MVASKYISKLIAVITAFAVALCFFAVLYGKELEEALHGTGVSMEYASELFDTEQIIQIDIQMDEKDWDDMLENAIAEEYHTCDVTINGQTFYSVAIRPKGNTSLSAIAMDDTTDRFSLKLEFDHYIEGQSCFGLDKLILNNNYADATNMKEAVVYDMYRYLDTDASLYNYARISLNGEYWGVYLALEAVEESFLLRNYGTQDGKLYKPDSMDMGKNSDRKGMEPPDFPDGQMPPQGQMTPDGQEAPDSQMPPDGQEAPDSQMPSDGQETPDSRMPLEGQTPPDGVPGTSASAESGTEQEQTFDSDKKDRTGMRPGGRFSMSGNGANLNYSDRELDSYSAIWDGEVTKTDKTDHRRVVTALEHISQGSKLETYLDIDNILKYMAVHTFSVNLDSLSGTMAHNYYLYEYNGRLNILPWDYNLVFGGMSMGAESGASEVINDAIDTPFSGTEFFDALLEQKTYRERYHGYLRQLTDEYVSGGRFDEVYERIRSQIDEPVDTDPNAFYSFEEYDAAAKMLYRTVQLRAESIKGQTEGRIPATDEEQKADSSRLVDASEIDIDTMGVFQMGGTDTDGARSKEMRQKPNFSEGMSEGFRGASFGQRIQNTGYNAVSLCVMLIALAVVKRYRKKPGKRSFCSGRK